MELVHENGERHGVASLGVVSRTSRISHFRRQRHTPESSSSHAPRKLPQVVNNIDGPGERGNVDCLRSPTRIFRRHIGKPARNPRAARRSAGSSQPPCLLRSAAQVA
jgi:hypothetical protein